MKNVLIALTSIVLAGSVYAAGEDHQNKFEDLDRDNSGTISQEEARSAGIDEAAFQRYDTDGDGELSEQEFKAKKGDKGAQDRGQDGMQDRGQGMQGRTTTQ